ncbi:uncharacterized protein LOC143281906 [Babylonia areolata]|uniref:uncharacterized protein LOC143281906 n=1 Tax=Babylonia areolata TaxID=304850 RepID=UPI003FD56231
MAVCQNVSMEGSCKNASVCESYTAVNSSYNLGKYVPGRNPLDTSALPSGTGFTVRYPPGENYVLLPNNTNCTLQTVMTFYCNTTALWSVEKSAPVLPVPVQPSVHFVPGSHICTYNFQFDFAGACPVTVPSRPDQLSTGSILIMMFIVLVILYFVMGCFINIARGKVGEELIPHHRFWSMLPVYIMDGIMFTVTCGGRSKETYERI